MRVNPDINEVWVRKIVGMAKMGYLSHVNKRISAARSARDLYFFFFLVKSTLFLGLGIKFSTPRSITLLIISSFDWIFP